MATSIQSVYKSSALFHIAGWIVFFIAPLLLSPPNEFESILTDPGNLESIVLRNLVLMGLFYFNLLFLAPVVLKNNGLSTFLFILTFIVVIVCVLNWQIHHFFAEDMPGGRFEGGPPPHDDFGPPRDPGHGPVPGRRGMMIAGPLFSSFLITVMVASISTTIVLWKDWVKTQAEEKERAFQKVASELAVLKLQISPHFLFNTLNNIRWLVRSKSEMAEDAVMKLSQLLRFILYQTNQEKISLEKELQNLRDYISLQQMRLTGSQNLAISLTGEASGEMVVPLLFIPLVENVFKYGDFTGTFLNTIDLTIENHQLTFKTKNLILKSAIPVNKEESGIGLENVKRRLMLHYPDKYTFTSFEKDGVFTLELGLILN